MSEPPTVKPFLNSSDSPDSSKASNQRPPDQVTGILFAKGTALADMKTAMRLVRDDAQDRRAQGWLTPEDRTASEERAAGFGKGGR